MNARGSEIEIELAEGPETKEPQELADGLEEGDLAYVCAAVYCLLRVESFDGFAEPEVVLYE